MILVNRFLTNKAGLESLFKQSKNKIYKILFQGLTTKKIDPNKAEKFITAKYKQLLPHFLDENPF